MHILSNIYIYIYVYVYIHIYIYAYFTETKESHKKAFFLLRVKRTALTCGLESERNSVLCMRDRAKPIH